MDHMASLITMRPFSIRRIIRFLRRPWLVEVVFSNQAKYLWHTMAFLFLDELPEFKRTVLEVNAVKPMESEE